jgi:transposase InsO family protein
LAKQGFAASERRVWRLCSPQRLWSVFSKKKGKNRKPGPPVHDDLAKRVFTADAPNKGWLTDITEHKTAQGKLYLCSIRNVFAGKRSLPTRSTPG